MDGWILFRNVGVAPTGNIRNPDKDAIVCWQWCRHSQRQIFTLTTQRQEMQTVSRICSQQGGFWFKVHCHRHQQEHWSPLTRQAWPHSWSNKQVPVSYLRTPLKTSLGPVLKCTKTERSHFDVMRKIQSLLKVFLGSSIKEQHHVLTFECLT